MPTELRLNWNTPSGGAGVSVLHVSALANLAEAQACADALRLFAVGIRDNLPNSVTLQVNPEVRVLNPIDGSLQDVYAVNGGAAVTGTGTGVYASASGIRLDLLTTGIVAGRRVRGRIYIVPATGTSFGANGNITGAAVTAISNAWSTYYQAVQAAGRFPVVYSRTHGVTKQVTGINIPARGAVLRSRRD